MHSASMQSAQEKLIDFHAHILPNFDDGPNDCEEAAQMLVRMSDQGITHVVSTSHFYRHEESIQSFLVRREKAFSELYGYLKSRNITNIPKIIPAAEVYFTTALADDPDLEKLCIDGTEYILIELPYAQITKTITDSYTTLASCGRVTPILAHIERYAAFADEGTLMQLLEASQAQINCGSLLSLSGSRLATRIIKSGAVAALGTDAHNLTTRPPRFAEARKKLSRKLGANVFAEIMDISADILGI
ncbi:MAG: hypothetical protein IJ368_04720 [Oscillospiraceae bacterium]|nr:hypothetical protein [Oscillospiraceae bacterium]